MFSHLNGRPVTPLPDGGRHLIDAGASINATAATSPGNNTRAEVAPTVQSCSRDGVLAGEMAALVLALLQPGAAASAPDDDDRSITVYFGIFEIFDPSRVRLYIRPSWPTTNPTIG
jgi:hypothetical protein